MQMAAFQLISNLAGFPRKRFWWLGKRILTHDRALEGMLLGSTAAGVVASIVVARSIGPAGRGAVVTLTVWAQLLGWLATLSLDKAVVVLATGRDAVPSAEEALHAARRIVVGTSCLAAAASLLLGSRFFTSAVLVLALATMAVATVQWELIGGYLLASGRRPAFIAWKALQPALYLTILVCVAILMRGADIQLRTDIMGIGASASIAIPVVFTLVAFRGPLTAAGRGFIQLLRFAATAHLGTILQYLNGRLDLLALSFLVGPASLGLYSVGAALGQLSLLTANAGVLRGMTGEAKRTDFVGLAFAGLIATLVIVAAPFVIPLVFGKSFVAAVSIARILAIGGVVNYALQGACGRLLGRRQPWMVVLSQAIGVVVFVIGIAIFRTLEGVASSSVISFLVSLLVAHAALRLDER